MSAEFRHPRGFWYIVGNEMAERFSYYGMRSILIVFMTTGLLRADGQPDPMTPAEATFWYHIFGMGNYIFPIFGALIADVVWGKYRTIILLSLVYCLGHLVLALDSTRIAMACGLALIAIGAGGIKPCVSAHLGDQYRHNSAGLLSEGYSLFYVAINIGAFLASIAIPWIFVHYGAHKAFAIPGIFMAVATVIFWSGRNRYVRVAPTPPGRYIRELLDPAQQRALKHLITLFVAVSTFWALFDQIGSSWVLQADRMSRHFYVPGLGPQELLASQLQAINPLLILVLAPIFSIWLYPWIELRTTLTVRARITSGLLLSGVSFCVVGLAQYWILNGYPVSIGWQVLAYIILTVAEVLVSVTTLELAYTQAPAVSKSFATSFYLLSVALGNGIAALYNGYFSGLFGGPESVSYFIFFAGLPLVGVLLVWDRPLSSAPELEA